MFSQIGDYPQQPPVKAEPPRGVRVSARCPVSPRSPAGHAAPELLKEGQRDRNSDWSSDPLCSFKAHGTNSWEVMLAVQITVQITQQPGLKRPSVERAVPRAGGEAAAAFGVSRPLRRENKPAQAKLLQSNSRQIVPQALRRSLSRAGDPVRPSVPCPSCLPSLSSQPGCRACL